MAASNRRLLAVSRALKSGSADVNLAFLSCDDLAVVAGAMDEHSAAVVRLRVFADAGASRFASRKGASDPSVGALSEGSV